MISNLIGALFDIIKGIWNAPTWLVVLVVVILGVLYLAARLFGVLDDSESSDSNGYVGNLSRKNPDKEIQGQGEKPEQPFVFYDSQSNRRGRGDCFYDSQGNRRSWGEGFYDGKGYYRSWGDSFYDARGNFRSWGECFYDAQGNLVYPKW